MKPFNLFLLASFLLPCSALFGQEVVPVNPDGTIKKEEVALQPLSQEQLKEMYRSPANEVHTWTEEQKATAKKECETGDYFEAATGSLDCDCVPNQLEQSVSYAKYQAQDQHHKSRMFTVFAGEGCKE